MLRSGQVTCGQDSPLTGSACHSLGDIFWKRFGDRENAKSAKSSFQSKTVKFL